VHANALDMRAMAVDGQVDIIVHGLWNWNELRTSPAFRPPSPRTCAMSTTTHRLPGHVARDPGVTDLLDPTLLDDPVYAKVVPPAILQWYRTEPAQWFRTEIFGAQPDAARILGGSARPTSTGPRPRKACARCAPVRARPAAVVRQRYARRAHVRQPAGYDTSGNAA
jgi:hypothetical protein